MENEKLNLVGYMAFGEYKGRLVPLYDYAGNNKTEVGRKVWNDALRDCESEGFTGSTVEQLLEFLEWTIHPVYVMGHEVTSLLSDDYSAGQLVPPLKQRSKPV